MIPRRETAVSFSANAWGDGYSEAKYEYDGSPPPPLTSRSLHLPALRQLPKVSIQRRAVCPLLSSLPYSDSFPLSVCLSVCLTQQGDESSSGFDEEED
jgi:hypothetical protein